jgi:hypothetical protein
MIQLRRRFSFPGAALAAARSNLKRVSSIALVGLGLPLAVFAQPASISSVSVPAAGNYNRTLALPFTVNFSSPVLVQGAPRLAIDVGGVTRYATAVLPLTAGAPTTAVTFEYLPGPSDVDADGITLAYAIDLNGGAITSVGSSAAVVTLPSTDTHAIRITVALPPTPRIAMAVRGGPSGDVLYLEGTADAGSMVMVTRTDVGVIGATLARSNGSWSFACPSVSSGSFQFTAAVENDAGIVSAESAAFRVTVSQTASSTVANSSVQAAVL